MTQSEHAPDSSPREDSSELRQLEILLKLETDSGSIPSLNVPGYEILEELGHGGMGMVFRARQVCLGREVALKVIASGALASPEQRQRFRREAAAVARLLHPNLVLVVEVGEQNGCLFYAMEWLRGGSLDRRLDGRPWPAGEAAGLVRTLAEAVHYAHQQGIVHRDLKPSNVLLTADGVPKIGDFGLALSQESATVLTRSGVILGTPAYLAPEQAAGHPHEATAATDTYALGVILYQLLTGRLPFRGPTPLLLQRVVHEEPPPPTRLVPGLPRDLQTICLKCLEKQPARRYASAAELADDLRRFHEGQPLRARPVSRAVRWWRRLRRRPLAAGLALLLFVLLPTGAGGLVLLRRQAEFHQQEASQQQQLATDLEAEAKRERYYADYSLRHQVAQLYQISGQYPSLRTKGGLLPPPSPDRLAQANTLRTQAQRLLRYLELPRGNPEATAYRLRLAVVLQRVGRLYLAERQPQEAFASFQEANQLLKDSAGMDKRTGNLLLNCTRGCLAAGRAYQHLGQLERAIPLLQEGAGLYRQLLEKPSDKDVKVRLEWFECCRLLSVCLEEAGRPASEARRQALQISSDLLESNLASTLTTRQQASLRHNQGRLHEKEGARTKAIDCYEQAAQLYERLRAETPNDAGILFTLGTVYHPLARQQRDAGRVDEALASYRLALAIRQRLRNDDPAHLGFLNDLAFTLHDLSLLQEKRGEYREALATAERALALHQELLAKQPDGKHNQRRVADRLREVAHLRQLLAQASDLNP